MAFATEAEFESALVTMLFEKGWERQVLKNYTEKDLIKNWAQILYDNNRNIDRLNNYPLTDGEMQQIIEQIIEKKSPRKLNGFINGKTISIKRDNQEDKEHFGKEVSLKIYDRAEIAAGQSRYQIVEQPIFKNREPVLNDRRGDLMLLINGMPVIHIELKKQGIPVSQAANQIEKYAYEGVFTGIFALVQIFVAMEPEETLYFANPGPDGKFNPDYYFHWADFNNEPINAWDKIAASLLSIPMAHQLIGFYTVADDTDGVLKVMRSYQYYAANAISDTVSKTKWLEKNHSRGGYIWHTTGSGKTMTSFKSAQLIANSKDADKVVFLVDRIELATQSLLQYRGFADDADDIQETEDTRTLIAKLKSDDYTKTLIVTSIQKMSNIKLSEDARNERDLEIINKKRLVFIVDEAHRDTFGDMMSVIKNTFPDAVFFGFTGTPIQKENQKKLNTTATVFGDELHRYSIADGIRDKNVLGFDLYRVATFKDLDVRQVVALDMAGAETVREAESNPAKKVIYDKFMDKSKVKMTGFLNVAGDYIKGIEDYLPISQYGTQEHKRMVVEDILDNWEVLSRSGKFHAIFATSSIPEAIEYYRMIKNERPDLKVTALFDPNIDNNGGVTFKEDGLVEIIKDYNKQYNQIFGMSTYGKMKKDIASRLAHKDSHKYIDNKPQEQINILIVVDQMLTGFDSKWVNTLYLDKILKFENIIQAFSRTNRLFGPDKPFGTIKYYRKPYTMDNNIMAAVKLYSGDKPMGLFVEKLDKNLEAMNKLYTEINELFVDAGVENLEKLPAEIIDRKKFAQLFNEFNKHFEAAKIQGFQWDKTEYEFVTGTGANVIKVEFTEHQYLALVQRYKELPKVPPREIPMDIPYDLEGYITEVDTGVIDAEYMNSRFNKYLRLLEVGADTAVIESALNQLHKTFATLDQEEQKQANIFLHDVQRGEVKLEEGMTFRDYVIAYIKKAKNDQIHKMATYLNADELSLRELVNRRVNEDNINEYGRFTDFMNTVNREAAKKYLESLPENRGSKISSLKVNAKIDKLLRDFIVKGGYEV